MSKLRMITFHTPKNYGAVLQAFSLMKQLEEYADDVKVIDYNTPHLRSIYPVIQKPGSAKALIKTLLMLPAAHGKKNKYSKFDAFVKKNLNLTQRFESTQELYEQTWDADLFVTGSDQVFNPGRIEEERKAFYLDFVPETIRKISYAGSFGVSQIKTENKEEVSRYLNSFSDISVREQSGVEIVKELCDREAELVLDPVFLHDRDFWMQYERPYKKDFGEYLFYYRLLGNKRSDEFVEKIAREKKLKLVVMSDDLLTMKADDVLRDVGPEEFLYLMNHAKFIVTNAFHGVAFSVIFKKDFVFSDANEVTNGRGLSILDMLQITKEAYIDHYGADSQINYEAVSKKLEDRIEHSRAFLKRNVLMNTEKGE